MLRYAITSRILFPGDEFRQQLALVQQCADWAAEGIDFIQLREKDLLAAELASLARAILRVLPSGSKSRLLINGRADIALATAAHGVHLTGAGGELTPEQVRHLFATAGRARPILSVSCHSLAEVEQARRNRVDAVLFAPVFEKFAGGRRVTPGLGLEQLRAASLAAAPVPVFALGGVTLENAPACIAAGAQGIAGIRLFHNKV